MVSQIQKPILIRGEWTGVTKAHLSMMATLTKSAILLYQWLLTEAPGGIESDFKLNEFLEFTSYRKRQISNALKLLEEKELIKLSYGRQRITVYHPPSALNNEQKIANSSKKLPTQAKNCQLKQKIAILKPETPSEQDFSSSSDHSDHSDHSNITTEPEIVVIKDLIKIPEEKQPEEEPKIVSQKPEERPEDKQEEKPEQQTEVKEKISARPANTNKLYQDCIKFLSPNPLSQGLKELLQDTNETTLLNSLAAVKEYCASHREVNNKAGMLRTAIIEKWQPIKPPILDDSEEFKNWFKEQRPKGKVLGSTVKDGKILIYCSSGECLTFEEAKIKIPLE